MKTVAVPLLLMLAASARLWAQMPDGAAIPAEPTVEKKIPQMRAVDRDWDFFAALDCARVPKFSVATDTERQLLARRQEQCLERYRAFYPRRGGVTP